MTPPRTARPQSGHGARRSIPVLLTVLAGACAAPAPPPPVDDTRMVDADRTAVIERAGGFLERREIAPLAFDRAAGTLRAGPAPLPTAEWADCPTVRVRDSDGERRRRAALVGRTVEVLVTTERQGGRTLATVRPHFVQTLRNSFTNTTFERPCGTTGRLERALLDAL